MKGWGLLLLAGIAGGALFLTSKAQGSDTPGGSSTPDNYHDVTSKLSALGVASRDFPNGTKMVAAVYTPGNASAVRAAMLSQAKANPGIEFYLMPAKLITELIRDHAPEYSAFLSQDMVGGTGAMYIDGQSGAMQQTYMSRWFKDEGVIPSADIASAVLSLEGGLDQAAGAEALFPLLALLTDSVSSPLPPIPSPTAPTKGGGVVVPAEPASGPLQPTGGPVSQPGEVQPASGGLEPWDPNPTPPPPPGPSDFSF